MTLLLMAFSGARENYISFHSASSTVATIPYNEKNIFFVWIRVIQFFLTISKGFTVYNIKSMSLSQNSKCLKLVSDCAPLSGTVDNVHNMQNIDFVCIHVVSFFIDDLKRIYSILQLKYVLISKLWISKAYSRLCATWWHSGSCA